MAVWMWWLYAVLSFFLGLVLSQSPQPEWIEGLDISAIHYGEIDLFEQARHGASFVFIRCTSDHGRSPLILLMI